MSNTPFGPKVPPSCLLLAVAFPLFGMGWRRPSAAATTELFQNSPTPGVLATKVLTDVQQLCGRTVQTVGGRTHTILTWVLGATPHGELTSAYLVAMDEDGNVIEYDGTGQCARVFEDLDQIKNVSIWRPQTGNFKQVDELKLISRDNGTIGMVFGSRDFVATALQGIDTACAWTPVNGCYPGGGCGFPCPQTPPACPCQEGHCSHLVGTACPSDGQCLVGETCTSDGDFCACD